MVSYTSVREMTITNFARGIQFSASYGRLGNLKFGPHFTAKSGNNVEVTHGGYCNSWGSSGNNVTLTIAQADKGAASALYAGNKGYLNLAYFNIVFEGAQTCANFLFLAEKAYAVMSNATNTVFTNAANLTAVKANVSTEASLNTSGRGVTALPGTAAATTATGGSIDGRVSVNSLSYDLCEFYYFRHATLKTGFQAAQGGLITGAATKWPEAWAYLQTTAGKTLCKTEAQWQALSTAIWATLADGTTVGWNGIGGAPWYVIDTAAGTLRLPDLRGMYAEASGFDSLGVGGVHGDAIRNITGRAWMGAYGNPSNSTGALFSELSGTVKGYDGTTNAGYMNLDVSKVVPTGNKVAPRAWGALACAYLGQPAS